MRTLHSASELQKSGNALLNLRVSSMRTGMGGKWFNL